MKIRNFLLLIVLLVPVFLLMATGPAFSQTVTKEQAEARIKQHASDFDYLLGDWEIMNYHKEYGNTGGFWSAVRMAAGPEILDEYRLVDEKGETFILSATFRCYNAQLDRWELISAEAGGGLQNFGTAQKVGNEMHIEQKFGTALWKIRYYNIKPDSFSWTATVSKDDGKTWVADFLRIEAKRIGPARSMGPLAPARKAADKTK
jgi:hypothetical protein